MLKLYFGNIPTIISTLLIIVFIILFSYVTYKRGTINNWGVLVLVIFLLGLFMSIMSGTKDVIATPNALFSPTSISMIILSIFGGIAFVLAILSIFIKTNNFWQLSFYIISAIIIIKIIIVEVSRIISTLKM